MSADTADFTDVGDIIGLGYSAYEGTRESVGAMPNWWRRWLESLELDAAVRMDKYKGGETSTTPKFGVKWKPADWIAVRGTYAEGFRAPNPAENGDGGSGGLQNSRDPVRCPVARPLRVPPAGLRRGPSRSSPRRIRILSPRNPRL